MAIVSGRLSAARKAKNMTRDQLAQELGVSRKLIARWESGRAEPTEEQCEALCVLLEIPYTELKPTPLHRRVLAAVALLAFIGILILAVYPIYQSRHAEVGNAAPEIVSSVSE